MFLYELSYFPYRHCPYDETYNYISHVYTTTISSTVYSKNVAFSPSLKTICPYSRPLVVHSSSTPHRLWEDPTCFSVFLLPYRPRYRLLDRSRLLLRPSRLRCLLVGEVVFRGTFDLTVVPYYGRRIRCYVVRIDQSA